MPYLAIGREGGPISETDRCWLKNKTLLSGSNEPITEYDEKFTTAFSTALISKI